MAAPRPVGRADRVCCGARIEQCGQGAASSPTGWVGGAWTWERALSPAEIAQLHAATAGPYAAAEAPRYAIAEAIGEGMVLHVDPAMTMLESGATPCVAPRGWHCEAAPGRARRAPPSRPRHMALLRPSLPRPCPAPSTPFPPVPLDTRALFPLPPARPSGCTAGAAASPVLPLLLPPYPHCTPP